MPLVRQLWKLVGNGTLLAHDSVCNQKGAIVLVMTRWSSIDLTQKTVRRSKRSLADQWDIVEFPAIFEDSENPLWPEFWDIEELLKLRLLCLVLNGTPNGCKPQPQKKAQLLSVSGGTSGSMILCHL